MHTCSLLTDRQLQPSALSTRRLPARRGLQDISLVSQGIGRFCQRVNKIPVDHEMEEDREYLYVWERKQVVNNKTSAIYIFVEDCKTGAPSEALLGLRSDLGIMGKHCHMGVGPCGVRTTGSF